MADQQPPGDAITGLKLVPFSDVLENVLQQAHAGLRELVETLPGQPDEAK